ncbi:MAG: hypothetical protein ACFCVK_01480 [Acidimicrobiales bacterium]
MSEHIIGTSQAAIDGYEQQALHIFARVNERMQQLVTNAFSLTYEGPDAETVFNPGLVTLATESVALIDAAVSAFAGAVSAVTSNISHALGAGDIVFVYKPPPLALPSPPGVAADDYRIDTAAFDRFLAGDLVDAQTAIASLFAENQAAFGAIPRATATSPGWSGEARDHAQNVVVPAQTENLDNILRQVVQQITQFMTGARDGTLAADRAGVGGSPGGEVGVR